MKIPILVIASSEEPVYEYFKRIKIAQSKHPDVDFYFMYGDASEFKTVNKETYKEVYVPVVENTRKGCTIKTLETLKILPDFEYVVRTNLSSVLHIDRLVKAVRSLPTNRPILSGFVHQMAYGSLMIWNKMAITNLLALGMPSEFPYNDDVLLSMMSRQAGIHFDVSLTERVVETPYSFFYNPPIRSDWIMVKRPRNEFTTRLYSDIYSINPLLEEKITGVYNFHFENLAMNMMFAIRFMDRTQNTQYIRENIDELMKYIKFLTHNYFGELIFYVVKYCPNSNDITNTIVGCENYYPDSTYIDTIFYFGIVKGKLTKETYDKLGMKTGTWRDL